ncbi:acyl-CoA dehydrogenase family protein [Actinocorallia libanotica]|uniref:Alkylation response protein AidB-like acyl-CoA dehydrogenase n=1 Tax=Actinocorallia libanotica TaxID=46162 RepID=A0ABN1RSK5_9ACTN
MRTERDSAEGLRALRTEVGAFLREWREEGRFTPRCDSWLRDHDPAFSRALAERGWIGLTWPREYGGAERSHLARLVVTEELLRAGAPVAAHWMADRQIGPAILRHGSAELKRRFLPGITRGETTFCVAMSETEAGSDLAAVRTTAALTGEGWLLNGRKVWTSHAHRSSHAYVLARTDASGRKHEGLSEFLLDLATPGVTVRPLFDLSGEHHFNEVFFDDVLIPHDQLLGVEGQGWKQVTEQLSFERGGAERVLSTYPLLAAFVSGVEPGDSLAVQAAGELTARLSVLRAMAWRVASDMDGGRAPIREAALLKALGTAFEKDVVETVRRVRGTLPDPAGGDLERLMARAVPAVPGFSLRGGTTEILGTIVAKGLTSDAPARPGRTPLGELAADVLDGRGQDPGLWEELRELGWSGAGLPEELGGGGGALQDLLTLLEAVGEHGAAVPLLETSLACWLLVRAGRPLPARMTATVALPGAGLRTGETLDGTIERVPWAAAAELVIVPLDGELVLLDAAVPGWRVEPGHNLAGEPRDTIHLDGCRIPPGHRIACDLTRETVLERTALLQGAQIVGALRTALRLAADHARTREQFGRPLAAFQAVSLTLAEAAARVEGAETALARAAEAGAGAPVAALRLWLAEAAGEVAAAAHQVHGAMGITREHPLHHTTRRLWAWRDEGADARHWAGTLVRAVGQGPGDDALWRTTGVDTADGQDDRGGRA